MLELSDRSESAEWVSDDMCRLFSWYILSIDRLEHLYLMRSWNESTIDTSSFLCRMRHREGTE